MIRALALRTMACIRVERIVDYLCEPLHRTLKDESPYVRKTAVTCVAKLFDISPDLVDENGFLDMLRGMLSDPNQMVVANVVSALAEIHQMSPETGSLDLDSRSASKLATALTDCTEWGQVAILDALAEYVPEDQDQLEFFIDSVLPRLQHVNPSIVLSAIKVLLVYIGKLPIGHESIEIVKKKLGPPLVTLLSSSTPEIQFVALRNIRLILQKCPDLLSNSIRVFFCKYTDPLYIKAEKLQLIVQLADDDNVEQIYPELADYAKEVDVEFVRRAIRAIGDVAARLPETVQQAAEILLDLSRTDIRYVVQEVLITARDFLRRFPEAFGRALPLLIRDPTFYDDPDARAALIWIIGEYDEQAVADYLSVLSDALSSFKIESGPVQSELFSSILKLFIRNTDEIRPLMAELIEIGKSCFESAELRDRAIFYERIVSLNPQMLRTLDLSVLLEASPDSLKLDSALLAKLMGQLGSLASIYHKEPEQFLTFVPPVEFDGDDGSYDEDVLDLSPNAERPGIPIDLLGGLDDSNAGSSSQLGSNSTRPSIPAHTNIIDLLS